MNAIFFDLDGTLLNDDNEISKENIDAIKELKKSFDIIITTGRSYEEANKYYDQLELDTYMSVSMGQEIYKNHKLIHSTYFKEEDVRYLVNNQEILVIQKHDGTYVSKGAEQLANAISTQTIQDISEMDSYKGVIGIFTKSEEGIDKSRFKAFVFSDKDKTYTLRPLSVDKGASFDWITNESNYQFTVGVGNGRSDIPFLKKASKSIAVLNGHSLTKKMASHVTTNDNNQNIAVEVKTILEQK